MEKKTFRVDGMKCAHCQARVEKTVSSLPGVTAAAADFAAKELRVAYDETLTNPAEIIRAVSDAGYPARETDADPAGRMVPPQKEEAPERKAAGSPECSAPSLCRGKFIVKGMSCAACQARVEKTVSSLPGVSEAAVNLLTREMRVSYDGARLTPAEIIQAVSDAGYGAEEAAAGEGALAGSGADSPAEEAARMLKQRILLPLIFLLPLSYLSMGPMFHLPQIPFLASPERSILFALIQLALVLPVLYWNRKYFISGFQCLTHGAPNMDSLIAVGSGAGLFYGLFVLIQMAFASGDPARLTALRHDLYFEAAGMILVLISFGKYLEMKSRGRTGDAIAKLIRLAPETAVVERGGREFEIPVPQLVPGDTVLLRIGSAAAVDGTVISGSAFLDQSAVTGESVPVEKLPGMKIVSGSVCTDGFLKFRAEKVGADTTLAKVIELVKEASASKAPISRLADRVSAVFVPVVIFLAILTFVVWLAVGASFSAAIGSGIAVLVVSCPCALGLATPVAIMVGTGRAAECGILFKNAQSLENLHKIRVAVFDKTGTLTTGKPSVADVIPADGETPETLLSLAAGVEHFSEHPFAKAIRLLAEKQGAAIPEAHSFQAVPGEGVKAFLASGEVAAGGNPRLLRSLGVSDPALEASGGKFSEEGKTPLYFVRGKKVAGLLTLADTLKPEAADAVRAVRALGIQPVMLTGDNARTAGAIAGKCAIEEIAADVLPAGKESVVREIREGGRMTAMIGDGVNDAPALARADVGIAIGAGTEIALEAADVVLVKDDLEAVPRAIRLSRAVIRNIQENLFWAFFYNLLGIPLAAGVFYPWLGWRLSPMFGAFAMSMSSFCVVTNALRLRRWKE